MRDHEDDLMTEALNGQLSRRDLIKRLIAAGLSASAIGGLLAEAGLQGDAEAATLNARGAARRGGTARFATVVPASDVDPVTMFNEGAIFTTEMSCEYLCYPRPNYTLAPKLATGWHPVKPNEWRFTLRKGVKWHDGRPFTADDVVYTFDLLTDPHVNSAALSAFKGILSKGHTKKVNAHEVVFHLDRPYVDFPYIVSAFNYNSVILPKGYKIGEFVKGRVGTGPFVLTKYTPKVGATYVRNTHYWAHGLPHPDGAEMKYYADDSSIVLAIQAGAVDIFLDMPYQGSQALFSSSGIKVLQNPSSAYREFHMRVDRKPFSDKRVRQAVALSLDRSGIIQGLLKGLGQVGNDHPYAPIYPLSRVTKSIPQRKQDYALAKKLLAEAGHPHGFSVTLTTENFLEIPQYAVFIQQALRPAGIHVNLNIENQNAYYGSGTNEPWLDVTMGIVDWAPRGAASQTIGPAYPCGGIWNSAHWCNKRFTHLTAQSDAELNATKRNHLVLEAAKIMHDEVPAVIAYWLKELRAVRTNVRGIAPGPSSLLDPSGVWLA